MIYLGYEYDSDEDDDDNDHDENAVEDACSMCCFAGGSVSLSFKKLMFLVMTALWWMMNS